MGLGSTRKFNKRVLATAIAASVVGMSSQVSFAAEEPEIEEVVVKGIRASIERAMDIKREANGVVDAISAEDIGKFPDTNLAESLQRITGVSISRNSGEGQFVTVRGFGAQYNLITLNGRMMPAADAFGGGGGTSRSFNMANLASEAVSGVQVYKTGRASVSSGGIGATINVATAKPMAGDQGFRASIGSKLMMDETNRAGDDITPELSGIFAWSNDQFGAGLSLSKSQRHSGSPNVAFNDWRVNEWVTPGEDGSMSLEDGALLVNPPEEGQLYGLPNNIWYELRDRKRDRTNAQLTFQYQPNEKIDITADYTFAENNLEEVRSGMSLWYNRASNGVVFDTTEAVASPVIYSEEITGGKDTSHAQSTFDQTNTLDSFGINVDFEVSDNFSLALDIHDSSMESLPTHNSGGGQIEINVAAGVTGAQLTQHNDGFPIYSFVVADGYPLLDENGNEVLDADGNVVPDGRGNANGILDAEDFGTQYAHVFYSAQTTDITQMRLDGGLEFENFDLAFGVETRAMEMRQQYSRNRLKFGDWGIANPGEFAGTNLLEPVCIACEFDTPEADETQQVAWRGDAEALIKHALASTNPDGGWLYGDDDGDGVRDPEFAYTYKKAFDQNHIVEEDTSALYVQLDYDGEINSMPFNLLLGLRYEETDVVSTSDLLTPQEITWTDNNDFWIEYAGTADSYSDTASYDNLLPSLDFDISLREDVKARFSYSTTIARAEYDQLRAASAVNVSAPSAPTYLTGQAQATQTNPGLVPLESNNIDLSVEWYFDDASYASIGFYQKDVKNFIGTMTEQKEFFGLRDVTNGPRAQAAAAAIEARADHDGIVDENELFVMTAVLANPQDYPNGAADFVNTSEFFDTIGTAYDLSPNADDPAFSFLTSQPINNRDAKIDGFELAVTHFFGDTGFGMSANYTTVNSDTNYDVTVSPSVSQFALIGLSDSANLAFMYDNYGVTARLAYNWRDEYLDGVNRGSSNSPTFVEEYAQWDLSVNYEWSDNLNFSLEGINLTGEHTRSHARSKLQIWNYENQRPRFLLGARYNF